MAGKKMNTFRATMTLCLFLFCLVTELRSSSTGFAEAKSAIMTLNNFQRGGDGGGPSECDGRYHKDTTLIVALSTEWYKGRCGKRIAIHGNGRSTLAKVVDECDTSRGCRRNIVDASEEVWESLGVKRNSNKWGEMPVNWNDA